MAKKPPSPYEVINTAPVGSEAWLNAFDALGPQDQAAIFNFGNDPTAGSFDTGEEGSADQFDFGEGTGGDTDLGLMGTGYDLPQDYGGMNSVSLDPMSQQLLQFGGGVNIPQYTSTGKLDPVDLGQEAARNNLFQDQVTSLMDLGQAALAGPGAYDPASFAPIVTPPKERLPTPGMDLLNRYAQGTGYRAYLAHKMLPVEQGGEGKTDDEALADLWTQVNRPDDPTLPESTRKAQQALINSLPANTFQNDSLTLPSQVGIQGANQTPAKKSVEPYNTAAVVGFASDLFQKSLEDQSAISAAYQDPSQPGVYYKDFPIQGDSPATKKFHDLGLPTPVEQYTDPKYLQMAFNTIPSLYENSDAYTQQSDQLNTAADQALAQSRTADQNFNDLANAWDAYQKEVSARSDADRINRTAQDQATAANALQAATRNLPENGPLPTPAATRTGPGINLGGRVTGTSSDTYGRVQLPEAQRQPAPYIMPQGMVVTHTPQQPWTRDLGNGLFQIGLPGQEAKARGPVRDPNEPTFDFTNPEARPAERGKTTPLTRKQYEESRTKKQAADRRFVQAHTQRFRNATYNVPRSDIDSLNSIWSAQSNRSTPYQDAILARLLAQRAVGLRGA